MGALRAVARECVRCPLHATRTNVVFADGKVDARVLCVGEAPGANEDATGLPFVGRAGKLLDRLLMSAGFPRNEVFICNVLKCRPPGNRNPSADEIERCSPFMLRQVELVAPSVVVAFGTFAAQTLLGSRESLGRLRGRTHLYRGFPLVVTYHPAALLRNPGWTRPAWEDLQRVRRIVDGDVDTPGRAGEALPAKEEPPVSPEAPPDQLTLGGQDG
jgi:DNA polymerase